VVAEAMDEDEDGLWRVSGLEMPLAYELSMIEPQLTFHVFL
jgi:hypothetical protein